MTAGMEWATAIRWGLGTAIIHRAALLAWMGIVWLSVGQPGGLADRLRPDPIANLPALTSPLDNALFEVWRRWDGVHYLNLAQNGYRPEDPGPTVFAPLTPAGIRALDWLVPGPLDLGAMVFGTLAFAAALTLLYRLCGVYYGDSRLAPWVGVVSALLPLSFFYSAPMSEALYLALVLGVFYATARSKWGWAALLGLLATLTRSQGALLAGIIAWALIAEARRQGGTPRQQALYVIQRVWPLALIPAGLFLFLLYRDSLGLPPLNAVYSDYSYVFFVNPLEGLLINLRWMAQHPLEAITNVDLVALVACLLLCGLLARREGRRHPLLVVYTVGYILVFVSKINFVWGTDEVIFTQSFARYSLALFPLPVMAADWLRRASRLTQMAVLSLSALGLLAFSALFTLGAGAP